MSTNESSSLQTTGPGSGRVGVPGIVGILTYLAGLAAFLLYVLIVFWPLPLATEPSPAGEGAAPTVNLQEKPTQLADLTFLGAPLQISDEQRLLILVITAGALGSLVHALRSAYWYVGNRNLVRSWVPKYLMLPFCGATLAVLFYLVVRGGFFSPRAGFTQTSPFGFCALACLVGLFSEQAVLKLKQLAETLFMTAEQGKDADPPAAESKPKENA